MIVSIITLINNTLEVADNYLRACIFLIILVVLDLSLFVENLKSFL